MLKIESDLTNSKQEIGNVDVNYEHGKHSD